MCPHGGASCGRCGKFNENSRVILVRKARRKRRQGWGAAARGGTEIGKVQPRKAPKSAALAMKVKAVGGKTYVEALREAKKIKKALSPLRSENLASGEDKMAGPHCNLWPAKEQQSPDRLANALSTELLARRTCDIIRVYMIYLI